MLLVLDVVLHDSQLREYARSYMSAKIRWAVQKISANKTGMK
jgi:hypothetical protein